MKKIVLLRHGESAWNKENRFTGWTDVDLTEKGVAEALKAGELLAEKGFRFQKAYTSYLKRAVKTLNCVLDRLNQDWIPVEKSWRLNEKHYGQLQGLNKAETAAKYGDEQVLVWRRSYDIAPHALAEDDPRNPRFEERYREVPDGELPRTESLEDAVERVVPYWENCILASLDPVALDRACVDRVRASEDHGKVHLIERIDSRNGMHTLDYAERLGMGSQRYELVELD